MSEALAKSVHVWVCGSERPKHTHTHTNNKKKKRKTRDNRMGEINKIKSILNTSHAHVQPFFSKSVLCDVCECVCVCVFVRMSSLCVCLCVWYPIEDPLLYYVTQSLSIKGNEKEYIRIFPPSEFNT